MFNARVFYYAGRHVHHNPDKLRIQYNAAAKFFECSVQHVGNALRNLQGATAASRGARARSMLPRDVAPPDTQSRRRSSCPQLFPRNVQRAIESRDG
jgi:hypothetical protein